MSEAYKPVHHVVLNEHTLAVCGGHIADGWAQVLAGDKDGYNHLDGVVHLFGLETREATLADFERFRCAVPPDFVAPADGSVDADDKRNRGQSEH